MLRPGLPWGLGLYPGPEEDTGGFQASRPPDAAGDGPHCRSGAALVGPTLLGRHGKDGTTVGLHRTLWPSGSASEPQVGGRPGQAMGVPLEKKDWPRGPGGDSRAAEQRDRPQTTVEVFCPCPQLGPGGSLEGLSPLASLALWSSPRDVPSSGDGV